MKGVFVFIIILFSEIGIYAQSTEKIICFNTNTYEINSNISNFPELRIKIDGKWKTFELIDEKAERFDFECEEIELEKNSSKMLVIRWSNTIYGTGGGSMTKGLQIWNLDSGKRLFNEIVSCSDESFGRHGASSYFVECQKQIQIEDGTIVIYPKDCKTEWSSSEENSDPTLNCELTTFEQGKYVFVGDELKKK